MKEIPLFDNEVDEIAFWENHDSTEYLDWSRSKHANFPNLKPSVKTISIRLPESMLNDIKTLANKKDIPYQSLMKIYLSEKIKEEFGKKIKRAVGNSGNKSNSKKN
ncbi:MAG TPA: BrnA antitoxin family protein [Spirochaetota bacterium]|nr:BrnA antitoxin family protein [Spirochaetota bacterium]HOS34066.1 BrnA antitoxin family protein [Spirochaetota bacterium]HOS56947.1 BrnA antitoxin family protein [Spirochaetota bacterium]HPK62705.1 BrnA antitoxin family protein [Spirochaetota bacterium]HQF78681.1 BrnA antitoxin family protein [Spirochaetota bacterium]